MLEPQLATPEFTFSTQVVSPAQALSGSLSMPGDQTLPLHSQKSACLGGGTELHVHTGRDSMRDAYLLLLGEDETVLSVSVTAVWSLGVRTPRA